MSRKNVRAIIDFYRKVEKITETDPRYKEDAYEFVMQALSFTQKRLKRTGHLSGKELLRGIKELGLEQFGPLARTVFEHWGITKTYDFGEIVFNMIKAGLMRKQEEDSREDFRDVYDFEKEFK